MRRLLSILLSTGMALGILLGVPMLALSGLYSLKYGKCVRMISGAEIGYEAYIDFSNPYFLPDAVLRTAEGNIIAKEVSPLHLTEIAAFGWAWPEHGSEKDFKFIWTAKTGVVKKDEEPELYQRLSQDLGETYYGAPKDMNTNTLWLFSRLLEEEHFRSDRCSTSLWAW